MGSGGTGSAMRETTHTVRVECGGRKMGGGREKGEQKGRSEVETGEGGQLEKGSGDRVPFTTAHDSRRFTGSTVSTEKRGRAGRKKRLPNSFWDGDQKSEIKKTRQRGFTSQRYLLYTSETTLIRDNSSRVLLATDANNILFQQKHSFCAISRGSSPVPATFCRDGSYDLRFLNC